MLVIHQPMCVRKYSYPPGQRKHRVPHSARIHGSFKEFLRRTDRGTIVLIDEEMIPILLEDSATARVSTLNDWANLKYVPNKAFILVPFLKDRELAALLGDATLADKMPLFVVGRDRVVAGDAALGGSELRLKGVAGVTWTVAGSAVVEIKSASEFWTLGLGLPQGAQVSIWQNDVLEEMAESKPEGIALYRLDDPLRTKPSTPVRWKSLDERIPILERLPYTKLGHLKNKVCEFLATNRTAFLGVCSKVMEALIEEASVIELEHEKPVREYLGTSKASIEVRSRIDEIAAWDRQDPILIIGESGTGKELVAEAIHKRGSRADGPFIAVNAAAIPQELLESELFGTRPGAYNGADFRLGMFIAARGGTIFLDEIAELHPKHQAKLLRVVENGEVSPVGSDETLVSDARIICATNERLTDSGVRKSLGFRSDLYFRISSQLIRTPSLRDNLEDLDVIAASKWHERHPASPGLPEDIRQTLHSLLLEGNVRELNTLIEDLADGGPVPSMARLRQILINRGTAFR